MGSYLAQVLSHRITATQGLAKSISFLKHKLGISVTDQQIADAEKATHDFSEGLSQLAVAYITAHFPVLPVEIIANVAATAAVAAIDAAAAGAGNAIKSAP